MKSIRIALMFTMVAGILGGSAHADEGFKPLFNGKDLTGWIPVSFNRQGKPDSSIDPQTIWMVKDGVLTCTGTPMGYVKTEKEYDNFVLKLEYRFVRPSDLKDDSKFRGNSGVLVYSGKPGKMWPICMEAQIMNPSAGSLFSIGGKTDNVAMVKGLAAPVGEWNQYEIICKGDTVLAVLNGKNIGPIRGCKPSKGNICLQSEGAPIHFRNIQIKVMD